MDKADYLTYKASTSCTQDTPRRLPCVFQTHRGHIDTKYCMTVLGSIPELGSWDRLYPVVARSQGGGVWRLRVDLPPDVVMEYKWIVYNKFLYQIVEYEPGDNRKLCLGDKTVMVEDFDDAVQKVTHISGDEVERLMSEPEVRNINADTDGIANNTHMPSGHFEYDEALVQMVRDLNPRMYVPDEYKTGILKKGLTSESYENASQIDGKNECKIVKKTGFDNSLMQKKRSDHGLEMSLVDVEKETRETAMVGGDSEKYVKEVDKGVWDNVKGFVKEHNDDIVKIGLFTGVALSAMLLYKRLF